MSKRTAVIVGATGAVGRQLTPLLVASPRFDKVLILHHRPTQYAKLAKVEERVIDFTNIPKPVVDMDVYAVFCCVGTTQKKAGSTEAFQKVDRDIPIALARWAAVHRAATFVGISSIDANAAARSVYLQTKGQMENGVAGAGVSATYILRPSLLDGERAEFRLAERVGNRALSIVGPLMVGPLRKYRAVGTRTVAKAMLACAQRGDPGVHIIESDVIQELGT
jgi:uncharacterized protein YbjT (DUF2867 family)